MYQGRSCSLSQAMDGKFISNEKFYSVVFDSRMVYVCGCQPELEAGDVDITFAVYFVCVTNCYTFYYTFVLCIRLFVGVNLLFVGTELLTFDICCLWLTRPV